VHFHFYTEIYAKIIQIHWPILSHRYVCITLLLINELLTGRGVRGGHGRGHSIGHGLSPAFASGQRFLVTTSPGCVLGWRGGREEGGGFGGGPTYSLGMRPQHRVPRAPRDGASNLAVAGENQQTSF